MYTMTKPCPICKQQLTKQKPTDSVPCAAVITLDKDRAGTGFQTHLNRQRRLFGPQIVGLPDSLIATSDLLPYSRRSGQARQQTQSDAALQFPIEQQSCQL